MQIINSRQISFFGVSEVDSDKNGGNTKTHTNRHNGALELAN